MKHPKLRYTRKDTKWRAIRLYHERGMSMTAIQIELGVSYQTVQRYINGWNENHFGVTEEDLEYALGLMRKENTHRGQ